MSPIHQTTKIQQILFSIIILLFTPSFGAVLGIDFGADKIKVAAVVPGRSFDIVLDESSKRSHPSLVVFDDDVRQYGTSASSLVTKRPLRSFLQFSRLLGKPFNTQMLKELQSNFIFNQVIPDPLRNTIRFVSPYYDPSQAQVTNDTPNDNNDDDEEPSIENAANILNIIASEPSISVEEVATMKLKHIKKMAETETEADIKDCVITVPEFWSYKERQALLDASQMAGLNVLGLINENTAAALQYALKRDFQENKTEIVVFFNMGSVATKVSLVKYFSFTQDKKQKKAKKTNQGKGVNGAFEVLSVAWDETLGGINFDQEIAQIIMDRALIALAQRKTVQNDFTDTNLPNKLRTDARFTARIRNAAGRAKKILSANTETFVSIEGIYKDEDFSTSIKREELYNLCEDLFTRSMTVLNNAVSNSGYDKEDIESIVLVGGGTRIPKIRELLTEYLGKALKEDLNADESPALGAAFRAANLSSTFRVRAVGMDDITPFAVGVRLRDLHVVEGEKVFKKRGALFQENNHLFRRRAVTLKHARDLKVELFYEKSANLPMDTSRDLGFYEISGVRKAIEKYNNEKYNITELPKISLSFLLDANGVVDLVQATASFTEWVTEEKEGTTKSKKSKDKNENDTDTEENEAENESDTENDADTTETVVENEKKEVEMISRKRTHRVELNTQRNRPEDVSAMSSADFAASAKILLELDERDRSVRETADARNELESYIFESRNRLYEQKSVMKVSVESEREEFLQILSEAEDWIWDVEKESAGVYKSKIRELKKIGNPLFLRADEISARPAAVDAGGKTLGQLLESVEMLRVNYSWVNGTEIDKLENMTKKAEKWLNSQIELQDEKSLLERPVFLSYEVYYKIEPIVEYAKKLLGRPKPYGWGKEKKKGKNDTNDTVDGNKTEGEEEFTAKIEVDVEGDGSDVEDGGDGSEDDGESEGNENEEEEGEEKEKEDL